MKLSQRLKTIEYDGYIEDVLQQLKKTKHIVIFGAGSRAQFLAKFLLRYHLKLDAFVVNQKYFKEGIGIRIKNQVLPVKCYEEEIESGKEITIVLGIAQSALDMRMFEKANISAVISMSIGTREDYLIGKDFYLSHAEELDNFYDLLADEFSRECMYIHYCGRLTGKDIPFIPNLSSDPQYVFDEFMTWRERECLVDCGAYTGDSIEEFMLKMPSETVKEFMAYALEPDKNNYKGLKEKYKNNPYVKCLCLGAYSKRDRLFFSNGEGELSAICDSGDTAINVDTIDHILGKEKATFIKMDVEGSELEALKGAKKQIASNTPRLAICVYHNKEDLYTIPQLIRSYYEGYRFYLRSHSLMPTELTLFCISKELTERNAR